MALSRLAFAFLDAWRQDQFTLTVYNDSLRQAFPESIPPPFDEFSDSYATIRSLISNILEKEEETTAQRAECQPSFPKDSNHCPEAGLAIAFADLLSQMAEIRSLVSEQVSGIEDQLRPIVSEDDHDGTENFEAELRRLRKQLKIDKIDRLASSEIEDDFVIVGADRPSGRKSLSVPCLHAVADDQPLGCTCEECVEASIWPIMNIEAGAVAAEGASGNKEDSEANERVRPKTQSLAVEPAKSLPRVAPQAAPSSKTRFWSPLLSWFDRGPPPQRVMGNQQ
jgi:hypothetical protein